ncbi:MAG: uracil phosphoribosyltransferase, partial [Phycisphaerales bacterium]|nr:uracil phosphoribosyltransferase [Phycisphaerales bacterium]
VQQKLSAARDANTTAPAFRRLLNEIAGLMTFEASRHFQTRVVDVPTPFGNAHGVALAHPVTLVPILRAGVGMTDGILNLIPEARVGHLGVYRDETTLEPVSYYAKLPTDIARSHVLLVDPMLATGGSASFAVSELKRAGCSDIRMICLVCAPDGVQRMGADHPDVQIFTAGLDDELDAQGYIRPGLGDAGDRIFGTH